MIDIIKVSVKLYMIAMLSVVVMITLAESTYNKTSNMCSTHTRMSYIFPAVRIGCWLGETVDE